MTFYADLFLYEYLAFVITGSIIISIIFNEFTKVQI